MSLRMGTGYRAICWLYVGASKNEWRKRLVEVFTSSSSQNEKYVGVCFGKYSRVVDFFDPSAKIASYRICRFVEKLTENHIPVSPSLVLCKPMGKVASKENMSQKIRAYTFYRPKSVEGLLSGLSDFTVTENREAVSSERFWNNSIYPIVEITYGDCYDDVIDNVCKTRSMAKWAADSSTIVSLRVGLESKVTEEDDIGKPIPAIVFLKASSFPDIDNIEMRRPTTSCLEWEGSMKRFGWYDLCDSFCFKNLHDLYEYVSSIKKENANVTAVSTLLLKR